MNNDSENAKPTGFDQRRVGVLSQPKVLPHRNFFLAIAAATLLLLTVGVVNLSVGLGKKEADAPAISTTPVLVLKQTVEAGASFSDDEVATDMVDWPNDQLPEGGAELKRRT